MNEAAMLRRIRAGDQTALSEAIDRYGSYVLTVIRNRAAGRLSAEDAEELSSDVFLSLWRHASEVDPARLRPWLGAVARNSASDRMRREKLVLPLEEQALIAEDGLWERLDRAERIALVRAAMDRLDPIDREIFYRFYDLCQSSAKISKYMKMPAATVRTRLARGRRQLKQYLEQGGIFDEA